MWRFIRDFICALVCLFVFEYNLYAKDYNQLVIMAKYIVYDCQNNQFQSFCNEKFYVEIIDGGDSVEYIIVMNRDSLLNIKSFKTIEYHGLVE